MNREELAKVFHTIRFYGLSNKQAEKRWELIRNMPEGHIYLKMAEVALLKGEKGE